MFNLRLLASTLAGVLFAALPLLDDPRFLRFESVVFFGLCGGIIGASCFFIYLGRTQNSSGLPRVLSRADVSLLGFVLLGPTLLSSFTRLSESTEGLSVFDFSPVPLAGVLLYGLACFLGAKAIMILLSYEKNGKR